MFDKDYNGQSQSEARESMRVESCVHKTTESGLRNIGQVKGEGEKTATQMLAWMTETTNWGVGMR